MKHIFTYRLLLFFTPLLFIQCGSSEEEIKKDYHGTLKYFQNQYGIEHFIENDKDSRAYITLPECFSNDYSSFSMTNKNNFVCFDNKVYFSVDAIPKEDNNHYAEYFNDEKTKNQEGIYIMRDYCVDTRAFGLTDETRSIYSNIVTYNNQPMHLGSVRGKEGSYGKELFYQFGVIAGKDTYYVLQAIMSTENTPFLYDDILELFKSFRIK